MFTRTVWEPYMASPAPALTPSGLGDQLTALLLFAHIAAMFAGFTLLADVFQFPDVLRYPAAERLALFRAHQSEIVPVYWMLAMTGFSQVLISVMLTPRLGAAGRDAARLALVFGVIAGFGQAMGFGRWAILVPWLAEQMADPSLSDAGREAVGLIEGAFNRYAGMLVGEHLSNIAWGFWLFFTGVAVRQGGLFDRRVGGAMMWLSPLFGLLAAEQLGLEGEILGVLTDFGFPVLALLHFALAAQLLWRNADTAAKPLGWFAGIVGAGLYAAMVWPVVFQ
tara:strand:- start:2198 stop:3037 length:840 start_codon:yes stop_codon:yes gene_type:complete